MWHLVVCLFGAVPSQAMNAIEPPAAGVGASRPLCIHDTNNGTRIVHINYYNYVDVCL